MSHYVVQALLDGNIMFHRETPLEAGVENLINEGLSMLLATTGGAPNRDAFVEVLRYYDTDPIPEVDLIIFADEVQEVFFEAESLTKGKVRTMSGKPHKVRKLKQDQGITPEEAARRISLKSETYVFDADTMEWDIDYLESYETPYGTKLDGVLYNPTTGESAEFEGITIETSIPDIDPLYANMEDIPTYEAENEDNLGPMFMAESKSTMPKIPKGIKKGGWELAAYIYPNGDIFSIEDFSKVIGTYDIWYYSGNIPKIDAPKNTWIYDDEANSWDWDKILDKATNQVNEDYTKLRAEEKKNCGCGQDPCKTYGAEEDERVVCFICNLTPEESDGEYGPMMSTLGGDACKDCAEEYGYRHPRDMIYLDAETFEAPKSKRKGFLWEYYDYGDTPRIKAANESYDKNAGAVTIGPAAKKAQKDGWEGVNDPSTPRIWGMMAKSPQWKPWVKDLTARCKYERHIMSETTDIFNGTAYWKKPGDYSPDHMGEDGDWEILTKDNKILLLYFYADDELSTRLMRKTFTVPKTKAKPKATTRKSKPKAKAKKPKYYLHFGEDFTADKDVYTGKKFAMTTIRSAKALANHMFNFGPMPNMTPAYADFTINGEHYGNIVTWETEIIDANTGEVVDYWTPTKEQKATYRKKGNAIKKAAKPKAKKTTTRKSKPKPKAKAKAKTGRKAPTISATKRKIGTRMRGNDGNMWQVKKSGKSQRWMAGAETQTQTFHSSIDSMFDELL